MLGLRTFTRFPFRLSPQKRWVSSGRASRFTASKEDDIRELNEFFPHIMEAAMTAARPFKIPSESKWLEKVLQYNVDRVRWPGCIINLNAMRELSGKAPDAMTPEEMHKAKSLAWCYELMNASYNIVDDLVDGGLVRWDKPAWCELPDVRLASAFDGILVEKVVYQVLRQHFKGSPCYEPLVDLMLDTTFGVYLGQNDDNHCAKPGRAMLEDFTPARYEMAARLKTSLIGFYSPVAGALLASGVRDPNAFEAARDISVDLSVILQLVDDYNDCFGDDKMDRSLDIRNGSLTWMILEAKRIANAKQMKILKENYGYDDQPKVDAVREVFDELGLKKRVMDYREVLFNLIGDKIENNAQILPPNIYKYACDVLREYSVEWCQRNQVEN